MHCYATCVSSPGRPSVVAELGSGPDFPVGIGKAAGPKKREGILLADIVGLAMLVGLDRREAVRHYF